jgi:hypothetical protein
MIYFSRTNRRNSGATSTLKLQVPVQNAPTNPPIAGKRPCSLSFAHAPSISAFPPSSPPLLPFLSPTTNSKMPVAMARAVGCCSRTGSDRARAIGARATRPCVVGAAAGKATPPRHARRAAATRAPPRGWKKGNGAAQRVEAARPGVSGRMGGSAHCEGGAGPTGCGGWLEGGRGIGRRPGLRVGMEYSLDAQLAPSRLTLSGRLPATP